MTSFTSLIRLAACVGLACSMSVAAEQLRVQVVDNKGQALPDAVLIIDDAALSETQVSEVSEHIVDQVNRQFTPFMTAVKAGSTITFPNSDNIRHHVYSFSEPKPFELRLYADGERPSLSFDKSGLVTLGCNIHDQMIAHIVITDDQTAFISDEKGYITVTTASDTASVMASLWHPWQGNDLAKAISVELSADDSESVQMLQLPVESPQAEEQPKSRLQQRFNRTGNL